MVHISDLAWSEEKSASILKDLKKGNKINVKVNEYVYKTIEDNNLQSK